MSEPSSLRYIIIGATVSVVALAAAVSVVVTRFPEALYWALGGWAIMAVVGIADGAWLARRHGKPGTGFLLALVVGMLVRLVLVCGGTALALMNGGQAPWGFLAGVVTGFVPLQVFGVVWFLRRAKRLPQHQG